MIFTSPPPLVGTEGLCGLRFVSSLGDGELWRSSLVPGQQKILHSCKQELETCFD